jgi:hypothetical protein
MTSYRERVAELVARTTPEARRFWHDRQQRLEPDIGRQREWVIQLGALGEEIDQGASKSDWRTLDLFWIRFTEHSRRSGRATPRRWSTSARIRKTRVPKSGGCGS